MIDLVLLVQLIDARAVIEEHSAKHLISVEVHIFNIQLVDL